MVAETNARPLALHSFWAYERQQTNPTASSKTVEGSGVAIAGVTVTRSEYNCGVGSDESMLSVVPGSIS